MIPFRGIKYTPVSASADSQNLVGTNNPDWLVTLGGNNVVNSYGGNDVILAGVRFDRVGNFTPFGGEAIFYRSLLDFSNDPFGSPTISNNTIDSGSGNDYVAANLGTNNVSLGSGNDIFDASGGGFQSEDYPYILGNNTVFAGSGDDIIYNLYRSGIENSTATIYAESGNDKVFALATSVYVDGGSGNDILAASSREDFGGTLFVDGGLGNDTILGSGIGEVKGDAGDDLIFGRVGVTIDGGTGADTIATLGNNVVHGGLGNDTIVSGTGNDVIYGDAGDNLINLRGASLTVSPEAVKFAPTSFRSNIVGGGNDTVYAGQGNDTIVLALDPRDPETGDFLTNTVTTVFEFGVGDKLDLTGLGLSTTDVSLVQQGADTSVAVGDDVVALLIGTETNSVIFEV